MSNYTTVRELVQKVGTVEPVDSIADFVSRVREISDLWQKQDWIGREKDEDELLNDARIVGQVWFRGHSDCSLSLRPGLYRKSTWENLMKQPGSPKPEANSESPSFREIFDLEHELRIDFTNYGHLLNQANGAKTAMDWYFLMQHHGVPTRLLDWTTNALSALFFALDGLRQQIEDTRRLCPSTCNDSATVSVWMIDAYWLANCLSEDWYSPLLPWSQDAAKYVPPLEHLIDKNTDSRALVPEAPMPIEPPAMHPRVAAQEGRFVIFGKEQDILDQKLWHEEASTCKPEDFRVRQVQFRVADVDSNLRDLAQLGVSKRTLFPDLAGLAEFVRWKHLHKVLGYKLDCQPAHSDKTE